MTGNCNSGTTVTNTQGLYGNFQVWLNENGIPNLILIPMLKANRHLVSTHTNGRWEVTNPNRGKIPSKRDTGFFIGMQYIDLRVQKQICFMI